MMAMGSGRLLLSLAAQQAEKNCRTGHLGRLLEGNCECMERLWCNLRELFERHCRKHTALRTSPKWLMLYIYDAVCVFAKHTNFSPLWCPASAPTLCGHKKMFFAPWSLGFSSTARLCRRLLMRARPQGLLVLLSSCRLFVELTKTDVYLVSDLSKGHR